MKIPSPQALLDTENNRARILRATRELINELGHHAVEMTAIAKRANIARATLYRRYPTKEHIYADVILLWGYEFARELSKRLPQGRTVGACISETISSVVQEAEENLEMIAAQVSCSIAMDSEVQAAYSQTTILMPYLLAIAMGDVQSQRQEWASRVIQDLLYANHVKLLLGTATKNFIVEELVQVAELLFNDVWNLPREQSKTSALSSVTTK